MDGRGVTVLSRVNSSSSCGSSLVVLDVAGVEGGVRNGVLVVVEGVDGVERVVGGVGSALGRDEYRLSVGDVVVDAKGNVIRSVVRPLPACLVVTTVVTVSAFTPAESVLVELLNEYGARLDSDGGREVLVLSSTLTTSEYMFILLDHSSTMLCA